MPSSKRPRNADEQGFDSVWLFGHLMDIHGPMHSFGLMSALAQRTRLAWAMARRREIESWGINSIRAAFGSAEQQAEAARLVLPLVTHGDVRL